MATEAIECVYFMPNPRGFDDLCAVPARKMNRRCGAGLLHPKTPSLLNTELTEISVYSDHTVSEPFR